MKRLILFYNKPIKCWVLASIIAAHADAEGLVDVRFHLTIYIMLSYLFHRKYRKEKGNITFTGRQITCYLLSGPVLFATKKQIRRKKEIQTIINS